MYTDNKVKKNKFLNSLLFLFLWIGFGFSKCTGTLEKNLLGAVVAIPMLYACKAYRIYPRVESIKRGLIGTIVGLPLIWNLAQNSTLYYAKQLPHKEGTKENAEKFMNIAGIAAWLSFDPVIIKDDYDMSDFYRVELHLNHIKKQRYAYTGYILSALLFELVALRKGWFKSMFSKLNEKR